MPALLTCCLLCSTASATQPSPPPLELLVVHADLVVVAEVSAVGGQVTLPSQRRRPTPYLLAELTVTRVLKGSSAASSIAVAVAPAGHQQQSSLGQTLGEPQVWLLRKVPGRDLYRADLPGQRLSLDRLDEITRAVRRVARHLSCGPGRAGLRACTALLGESSGSDGSSDLLIFAVANISDQPVWLCTHPDKTRLKLLDDATGLPLPISLYKWIKRARLKPVTAADFVQIDPGQVLLLNQRGAGLQGIGPLPRPLSEMAGAIRIELSATQDGSGFGLEQVWTGSITTGPIDTAPTTTAPGQPSSRPAK